MNDINYAAKIDLFALRCYLNFVLYIFSYIIDRGVCFLALCEKAFSKRLAFAFLEELQSEFTVQYGSKVDTVSRPYSFIEFGEYNAPSKVNRGRLPSGF